MAAFQGSNINSLVLAAAISQYADRKMYHSYRRASVLMNVALGAPTSDAKVGERFEQSKKVSGRKLQLNDVIAARPSKNIIDGPSEFTVRTPTAIAGFGGREVDIAHYGDAVDIQVSQMVRIDNEEQIGEFAMELAQQVQGSLLEKYAQDLNRAATGAGVSVNGSPSSGYLGSWLHAISDGVSTGETNYAVGYGGLDRTDAANANLRGIVQGSVGTLTLGKLFAAQTAARANMGNPDVAVCSPTTFNIAHALVEGKTQVIAANDKLAEFGQGSFAYAGINYGLEAYAPSDTIGLLDSSTWLVRYNESPLVKKGPERNPMVDSGYLMFYDTFLGVFCKLPSRNVKLTGITG